MYSKEIKSVLFSALPLNTLFFLHRSKAVKGLQRARCLKAGVEMYSQEGVVYRIDNNTQVFVRVEDHA
jgi:hypothetical protein